MNKDEGARHILQREVTFLGHVINENGISPNPECGEACTDESTKKYQRDERILGGGKLLRKFIAGFSRKVKPLVDLTRKNVKCNLKRALTGAWS